jgi:hypothetical protein
MTLIGQPSSFPLEPANQSERPILNETDDKIEQIVCLYLQGHHGDGEFDLIGRITFDPRTHQPGSVGGEVHNLGAF